MKGGLLDARPAQRPVALPAGSTRLLRRVPAREIGDTDITENPYVTKVVGIFEVAEIRRSDVAIDRQTVEFEAILAAVTR